MREPAGQIPLSESPGDRQKPAPAEGLSRSAIIIGMVSLFADISTEMMYPLLPAFITQVLGAPVIAIGLIEGIAQGTASVVTGFSGWISDRIRKRRAVAFVGYALTAISKPLIGIATGWTAVLGARFADRLGKGIRGAPRDALLAETTHESIRGRAFGFERAMDSTGAVTGPLLALALAGWAGLQIRTIFMLTTIPALIAALLILMIKEKRSDIHAPAQSIHLSMKGTTPEYRRLLAVTAVFGLANSANAFLILRAGQIGMATVWTVLAYALFNAVSAAASMPAGAASDRFGRRNLLILGYGIYAFTYFGFGAAGSAWMVWPLFALYGLFPALTDGVAKALAVDTAGSAGRATAIGVYSAVVGITQIAASYIGGVLWQSVSPQATFYFGAALSALSVAMLFILLPSRLRLQKVRA